MPSMFEGSLFAEKNKKEQISFFPGENEYDTEHLHGLLTPLPGVIDSLQVEEEKKQAFTHALQTQFDRMMRTEGAEISSPRIESLTKLAQNMLHVMGSSVPVRVIILNKGLEKTAYVCADNTICISQSLLNELETYDEIAAIVAHEVVHILNHTAKVKASLSKTHKMGAEWTHEIASDWQASELLTKLGFNSTAMRLIEKISFNQRGIIHQSGTARAAQVVGRHYLLDSDTSTQKFIPVPMELHGEVKRTNREVISEALHEENIQLVQHMLPLLHPEDLYQYVNAAVIPKKNADKKSSSEFLNKFYDLFDSLITRRLLLVCKTDYQVSFFFSCIRSRYLQHYPLLPSQRILSLDQAIQSLSNYQELKKIHSNVFSHMRLPEVPFEGEFDRFISFLSLNFFRIIQREGRSKKQTEANFIKLLQALRDLKDKDEVSQSGIIKLLPGSIDIMVRDYIRYYRYSPRQQKILLHTLKEAGINVSLVAQEDAITYLKKTGEGFRVWVRELFTPPTSHPEPVGTENRHMSPEDYMSEYISRMPIEVSMGYSSARRIISELVRHISDREKNEKNRYIQLLFDGIEKLQIDGSIDVYNFLESKANIPRDTLSVEEKNQNISLHKLLLLVLHSHFLFVDDTQEYYEFLRRATERYAESLNNLSESQLINLIVIIYGVAPVVTQNKILNISTSDRKAREYKNLHQFDNLIPFQLLQKRQTEVEYNDLSEFFNNLGEKRYNTMSYLDKAPDIFSQDFLSVLVWPAERKFIVDTVKNFDTVDINKLLLIHRFLEINLRNDLRATQILRQIEMAVLQEPKLPLEDKIDFLLRHFNSVGIDGCIVVAKEIRNFSEYIRFRNRLGKEKIQKILNGSENTAPVAATDLLSSLFKDKYLGMLETSQDNPRSQKEKSTQAAYDWLVRYLGNVKALNQFDEESKKFIGSEAFMRSFTSFKDILNRLHDLDSASRFGLVSKALTEVDGLLASQEKRELLAKSVIKGIDVTDPFVIEMVKAVATTGKADIVTFPISQMMGRLLFRSLQGSMVDYPMVAKKIASVARTKTYIRQEHFNELKKITSSLQLLTTVLESTSRELFSFMKPSPENIKSTVFRLYKESVASYYEIIETLEGLLNRKNLSEIPSTANSVGGLFAALEVSGAGIVRQMQLASQFRQFSPEVQELMSHSLDNNPGMNHLNAWENLFLWTEEYERDSSEVLERKRSLRSLLSHIELGEKIGGGSLFTVFRARYRSDQGEGKNVVLKLQNPNAQFFIESGYELTDNAYTELARRTGRYENEIKIGKLLNSIAREWSLRDLNDDTFIKDDARFKKSIEFANADAPFGVSYQVSEILYDSPKVKMELEEGSMTVNRFLKSDATENQKKRVLQAVCHLIESQLQFRHCSTINDQGVPEVVIHADQHLGNYMVEIKDDKTTITVIDRTGFIKLSERESNLFSLLLVPGSEIKFYNELIAHIFEHNSCPPDIQKKLKQKIQAKFLINKVKNVFAPDDTILSQLPLVFESLAIENVSIPLYIEQMIRNILAYREIKSQL